MARRAFKRARKTQTHRLRLIARQRLKLNLAGLAVARLDRIHNARACLRRQRQPVRQHKDRLRAKSSSSSDSGVENSTICRQSHRLHSRLYPRRRNSISRSLSASVSVAAAMFLRLRALLRCRLLRSGFGASTASVDDPCSGSSFTSRAQSGTAHTPASLLAAPAPRPQSHRPCRASPCRRSAGK